MTGFHFLALAAMFVCKGMRNPCVHTRSVSTATTPQQCSRRLGSGRSRHWHLP
jgi:hypothetical protein